MGGALVTYYTSREVPIKMANEIRTGRIDLTNDLDEGETCGGTPTITASSSGLVISSVTVSTAALTILSSSVATGQAVSFIASAGTAGKEYDLLLSSTTSRGQTVNWRGRMRVVE